MASAEIIKLKGLLRDKALPPETSIAQRRALMEKLSFRVAEDIAVETLTINGRGAEILRAPGVNGAELLLYLHGGGYVMGSPNTHRALAGATSEMVEIPLTIQEKRQPSVQLTKRVPRVLGNIAKLVYVIRLNGTVK